MISEEKCNMKVVEEAVHKSGKFLRKDYLKLCEKFTVGQYIRIDIEINIGGVIQCIASFKKKQHSWLLITS